MKFIFFLTGVWDCLWVLNLWRTGRQELLLQESQLDWCRGSVGQIQKKIPIKVAVTLTRLSFPAG